MELLSARASLVFFTEDASAVHGTAGLSDLRCPTIPLSCGHRNALEPYRTDLWPSFAGAPGDIRMDTAAAGGRELCGVSSETLTLEPQPDVRSSARLKRLQLQEPEAYHTQKQPAVAEARDVGLAIFPRCVANRHFSRL